MSHPHWHQHLRKRLHHKLAPFPHPIRWKRRLDRAVAILGFFAFFATLPQVYEIWANQDAGGVSLISWGYYTIFAYIMFLYGIAHEERPIIITYFGSSIVHTMVTLGVIIY